MQRLKNKSIYIGREDSAASRLIAVVDVDGQLKKVEIAAHVPTSVSRLIPEQRTAHCKLFVDDDLNLILTNLKENNTTQVQNAAVGQKVIRHGYGPLLPVSLGKDNVPLPVDRIIEKIADQFGPREISVAPLYHVWEQYDRSVSAIRNRQKRLGVFAGLGSLLSFASMILGGRTFLMTGEFNLDDLTTANIVGLVLVGVFVCLTVLTLYLRATDRSAEKLKQLERDFRLNWRCPNCRRPITVSSDFFLLRELGHQCPGCRGVFV